MPPVEGNYRVLVVDDSEDIATTMKMLLELKGHDVQTAPSGSQALQLVESFEPQLVLLDLSLPDMSGHDVVRAIRSAPRGKQVFIVAVTGWASVADRSNALAAGFDQFLAKPVDFDRLDDLFVELEARTATAGI
jgi:CheY-like chemotaxis protein